MTTIALLGATGRTGRLLISQGQARGVAFKALARDPAKLLGMNVAVVQGDVTQGARLEELFAGCDAVVSVLGPVRLRADSIHARAMKPIVDAMHAANVKRYVGLTSAAAVLPGQPRGVALRVMLAAMGLMSPHYVADKKAEVDALVGSDLEWTLVRVPGQLVDAEGRELEISDTLPGMRSAQRQAVARMILDAVLGPKWVREAPFAQGAKRAPR